MNSKLKRLLLAAFLSGTGVSATFLWYNSTNHTGINIEEVPLAQVGSVSEEVLRRPPTRLLWHAVNTGDALYNGEAIRTSDLGEVRIQFEDGRYIDLEPDSLIVLSQAQGEVSLDLMEGSLFVNAKAETKATGLVLNSAQGKVELTGASASLSKTDGQKLNLQVVEGSAKVQSKDGQTKEITSGKAGVLGATGLQFDANQIKIISPTPNKSVYVDPNKKPEINFNWAGFPKGWKVSLLAGTQRRQLKELQSVEIGQEKTTAILPLGRHYWKIVAQDPTNKSLKAESPTYRLDVMALSTPAPLLPAHNSSIEFEKFPGSVLLQWQKSEEASQVMLEVAKDPLLRNKVVTQSVGNNDRFNLQNLSEGSYYWRLSSYFPDIKDPWSGPIQQFNIVKKADTQPLQVDVAWNQVSPEQFYIDQPLLELAWNAGPLSDKVAKWKVSWKEENNLEAEPESLETSEKKLSAKLSAPGRFIASVEAYDEKGRIMGKSENVQVSIQPQPLLPSPQVLPSEGQLVSQADGRSEVVWSPVEGAKHYQLVISSKEGKELLNKTFNTPRAKLANLMPGEYQVVLYTVDQFNRMSAEPTVRSLLVPDKSNLRAPAVKKVKVN